MPLLPCNNHLNRPLGFSTGCLHKFMDSYSAEAIEQLSLRGQEAIEVICARIEEIPRLPAIAPLVKMFAIKSVHLPLKICYDNSLEIRTALKQLEDFYLQVGATTAVIHPESVADWSIFDDLQLDLAIENLDDRKPRWFGFEQFEKFFDRYPDRKMVLDLNHCYTYGDLAERTERYVSRFGDRITEIHLSGCETNKHHCRLFKYRQREIVDCLSSTSCPIIIESPFDNLSDIDTELQFISDCLK